MVALPIIQVSPFRFLTPEEAAEQTGLTAAELLKRAEAGKILSGMFDRDIRIAVTQDGQVVEIAPTPQDDHGDDINARLAAIKREDFAHLEGEWVTLSEASQEFGIPRGTLRDWLYRGYIRGEGKYPVRVNKADMAYCAAIYQVRKQFNSRAPLLNEDGTPYLLKEPELARLRRLAKV